VAAPTQASLWPAAGGGPARTGAQAVEPGALPATGAWSRAGESVRTPALITGGGGPAAQRVVYGTADGRVHIRSLDTGAAVGPPGGTLVADAPLTDPAVALGPGFVSTSTETEPGVVFVVHNDGGGIDIARFEEQSGNRAGGDVALPDSLGCTVAGSPLLSPVAADGTRFLLFTISGGCTRGASLVRVPVGADPRGALGDPVTAPVTALNPGVDPALVVVGSPPRYAVAVARANGLDVRALDSAFAGPPEVTAELGETPDVIAAPDTAPLPTPSLLVASRVGTQTHVVRLDQTAEGRLALGPAATVNGGPTAVALASTEDPRVVVGTEAGLFVLGAADLIARSSVGGAITGLSASGDLVFAARQGRLAVVRLTDASVVDAGGAPGGFAPAVARGFVTNGPLAVRTTDVTAPSVSMPADARGLRALSAIASDDRGVAGVVFRLSGRRLVGADTPVDGSRFAPGARYEAGYVPSKVAPGAYTLAAVVRDEAGNAGRAQRPVRVSCQRTRRGTGKADVLRGGRGRDCLSGGGGRDRLLARDHSPDALTCGPGRDSVRADAYDHVARDCETVRRR
jgi:hypothetical protein